MYKAPIVQDIFPLSQREKYLFFALLSKEKSIDFQLETYAFLPRR
jgi:hypothetical protein